MLHKQCSLALTDQSTTRSEYWNPLFQRHGSNSLILWGKRSTKHPHHFPDASSSNPKSHIFPSISYAIQRPLKPELSDIERDHRQISSADSTKTEAADQMCNLIYGLLSLGSEIPVPSGVVQGLPITSRVRVGNSRAGQTTNNIVNSHIHIVACLSV